MDMISEIVFAVFYIFCVSHLGFEAAATVGLTESLLTIIYALAIGLSIGAMAMIARRIGEQNPDGAARAAVQAIALALILSILIAIVATPFSSQLLAWMGGSPWVIEHGVAFTRVMLACNFTVVTLFMVNAVFCGAGDCASVLCALWIS